MGKMGKNQIDALKREDMKENNWEIDQGSVVSGQGSVVSDQGSVNGDQKSEPVPVKSVIPDELMEAFEFEYDSNPELIDLIIRAWKEVDPEIREMNPLWLYSVKQDDMMTRVTLIFRNGQKIRVLLLPENEK